MSRVFPDPAPTSPADEDKPAVPSSDFWRVPPPRVAGVEEWQAGRAGRRMLAEAFNDPQGLRREESHPRKDAVLRRLNGGKRGPRFAETVELEQTSLRSMIALGLPLPLERTAVRDASD